MIKGALSRDEQALWDYARATMEPLRDAKDRVLDGAADDVFAAMMDADGVTPRRRVQRDDAQPRKTDKAVQAAAGAGAANAAPGPSRRSRPAPELAEFDRKSAKRLRAGAIDIEARIDLHGMREHEAHAALQRFLGSCRAAGKRWVLVITGKGAPPRSGWFGDDGEPPAAATDDFRRPAPRGVIRRNVPRWLAEPDLRAIVVSFTQAAPHHGGEGALYVQLRKRG